MLDPLKGENEPKEVDKLVPSFNIEHEFSKFNIPVPLVELDKNPSYYKQIEKFM
jgi:hypothetical protein